MSEELPQNDSSSEEVEASLVAYQRTRVFRGQLPPPEALRAYEQILPGITSRLWDEVEREGVHRREMEARQIAASESFMQRAVDRFHEGQRFVFVLIPLLVIVGTALALTGHDNVAGVIFGTTVIAIASIFVLGRTHQPGKADETEGPTSPSKAAKPKRKP